MKKLRYKFVLNILLTSTLPLVILASITIIFLHRMAVNDAQERIKNNLNTALSIYQGIADNLRYIARDQNQRVCALIETNQTHVLRKELKMLTVRQNFDFFVLTDDAGKVTVSISNPFLSGADFSKEYFVQKVLSERRTYISTEIVSEKELRKLGIIKKAKISDNRGLSTRGLVLKVVTPIINRDDVIVGTMSAGYLLNNNGFIVDKITGSARYPSSIFLEETRISTNLPYSIGRFALGSSVNSGIAEKVLKNGKNYIGRVWIVNQWYMAGYSPLYNYNRDAVGILGISIPEYTIFVLRDNLVLFFSIVVFMSIILALMVGIINGNRIVGHIAELHKGIEAFGRGDYNYNVKIDSGDEIEELGDFFNQTMSQLKEARRNVIDLRREVRKSSEQLEWTQKQLLDYEKMAAMGKMATAINHELKNVFAEIDTSVSYLRSKEVKVSPKINQYLKDIENGVNYANEVLTNLLRLSHPQKLILSEVDINFLIEDLLFKSHLNEMFKKYNIEVIREFDSRIPKIKADGLQLREVFSNLITNSIQAMQEGGELTIVSKTDNDLIRIEVTDTGGGIANNLLENIFTPFFTTKSKGMGLGLCIAKDIVEAHKGTIEVETDSAAYTTFIIHLPTTYSS